MTVLTRLETYRSSITPDVQRILDLCWKHLITKQRFISVSALKIDSGNPELVDTLFYESSYLLRKQRHPRKLNCWDECGEYAEPTLLSAYCLSELWSSYEQSLCLIIQEAADEHRRNPDGKEQELVRSLTSPSISSERLFFLSVALDLLGWCTSFSTQPTMIKVTYKDDLSRIALGLETVSDYLLNHLASEIPEEEEVERALPLDSCAARVLHRIKTLLLLYMPDSLNMISAIETALCSQNDEDRSNAVHSCRKLLVRLADTVFSPRASRVGKRGQQILLGHENYINRLACFIEDSTLSGTQESLLTSSLNLVGERLEAVHSACTKGSHTTIYSISEADSYALHTILLVGEILDLLPRNEGEI
jgi:hypothetical protein